MSDPLRGRSCYCPLFYTDRSVGSRECPTTRGRTQPTPPSKLFGTGFGIKHQPIHIEDHTFDPHSRILRPDGQMNSIIIRALESTEWAAFRDFRLQALQAAPGVFASAYETEITKEPEEWRRTVKGPAHQVFGLF